MHALDVGRTNHAYTRCGRDQLDLTRTYIDVTQRANWYVVAGTKFAANTWINLYDYNEPNLWGCTGSFD